MLAVFLSVCIIIIDRVLYMFRSLLGKLVLQVATSALLLFQLCSVFDFLLLCLQRRIGSR